MNLDNTDYQKLKSNPPNQEVPETAPQSSGMIDKAMEANEKIKQTRDNINRFRQLAQNTMNAIRTAVQFIVKVVSFICSPHGLIAIGVVLALWLVFMGFAVVAEAKEGESGTKCEKLGDGSKEGRLGGGGSAGGGGGSTVPAGGKIEALEQVLSQPIDEDGAYGAQCWDLANWYSKKLGGPGIVGASGRAGYIGHEFPWDSWGFDVIKDPNAGDLKPGDIICWYPGGSVGPFTIDSTYGHVGIIAEVKADGVIETYEQNAEKGQIVARYTRQFVKGSVSSVIRKKGA